VVPVTFIVIMLHLSVVPLETAMFVRFLFGAAFVVVGLTLFLVGVDKAITPLGNNIGEVITKSNNLTIVLVTGLILGLFITLAEPGLIVFANQVEMVSSGNVMAWTLLIVVSLGLAVLLAFGFYRIVYHIDLHIVLTILYIIVFFLALRVQPEMLVIAFDASGSTTGVLAVPFILALAYGISHLKRDVKEGEDDSFGIIAIVSVGAIISVLMFGAFGPPIDFTSDFERIVPETTGIFSVYMERSPRIFMETFLSLLPILATMVFFQLVIFRFPLKLFSRFVRGFIYAMLGLFIFLLGVNGGFMDVGAEVGRVLTESDKIHYIIIIAFFLGITTILAEPAVHVLTQQIEQVTTGYISGLIVLIVLALGVGLAVALATLRIFVEPLQVWHYLLPGYIIAIGLTYLIPRLFTGIAFDAGGVATGPMTATFILAFVQGASHAQEGADVILDGFGMIAMVALIPILTLEILGLVYKYKSRKTGV